MPRNHHILGQLVEPIVSILVEENDRFRSEIWMHDNAFELFTLGSKIFMIATRFVA